MAWQRLKNFQCSVCKGAVYYDPSTEKVYHAVKMDHTISPEPFNKEKAVHDTDESLNPPEFTSIECPWCFGIGTRRNGQFELRTCTFCNGTGKIARVGEKSMPEQSAKVLDLVVSVAHSRECTSTLVMEMPAKKISFRCRIYGEHDQWHGKDIHVNDDHRVPIYWQ